jgi:hypothetical protein
MEERNYGMPKAAIAISKGAEGKMELASSEEMARRKQFVARLRLKMAKPATESDKKLWQEFMDLGKERLTFRS